jgi:hypothetical protein
MEVLPDGTVEFWFHDGQERALSSTKRFILVLAGTQSGKTVTGPAWLYQEILDKGPGEYLVAAPTFKLLYSKAIPAFRRLFESALELGKYRFTPEHVFTFSKAGCRKLFGCVPDTPTIVRFGHAGDSESLEAATYKAAWLDEAGQKGFKEDSWDAVLRRLAVHQGRCLLTTTPYRLGWLKTKLFDPWKKANGNHPDIDVINFRSIDNPAFPRQEYEDRKRDMPPWKFEMFYKGLFSRPAGLVYDAFDTDRCVIPRFAIPDDWPRWVGIDFGPVNTAAVFFAEEMAEPHDGAGPPKLPTGRLFAYREYHHGNRSSAEHVRALLRGEPRIPNAVGGAPRIEQGWRDAFRAAGLPVKEPDLDRVEPGIDRVYAAMRNNQILVFDDLTGFLDELATYSYELDEQGEPTDKLEDPHSYHLMDSLRYAMSVIKKSRMRAWIGM